MTAFILDRDNGLLGIYGEIGKLKQQQKRALFMVRTHNENTQKCTNILLHIFK
jgi:hypothetical protein